MVNTEKIGERIARLRRAARPPLAQYKLAEKVGLHPSSLNQIEKGKRTPKTATITALATALGVSRDLLLDGNTIAQSAPGNEDHKAIDISDAIGSAVQTAIRDVLADIINAVSVVIAEGIAPAAVGEGKRPEAQNRRTGRAGNARR